MSSGSKSGLDFFAVLGVVADVADLFTDRGGFALVSALSGQSKSKSSDAEAVKNVSVKW